MSSASGLLTGRSRGWPATWASWTRLASPAMRAEYERRAGIAASYREAAGITDPEQAIAPDPHEGNPELETARQATMRALEIRDEAEFLRGLSRGELETRVAEGERAMAAAPPDVSAELRRPGRPGGCVGAARRRDRGGQAGGGGGRGGPGPADGDPGTRAGAAGRPV